MQTLNYMTFTTLSAFLLTAKGCHDHPSEDHHSRHGRFTNSAFGKPWNKNTSPKNYSRVAKRPSTSSQP